MQAGDVIYDAELGSTAFIVERITYTRNRGGTTSCSITTQAQGCIHPGTPEMIRLLPEEEKNEQFIVIYTDYALGTGMPETNETASFTGADRILWNGQTWRVVRVRDWQGFGYCQAFAVRIRES